MANKRKRDSSTERIQVYQKKIRELVKKQRQKRRRIFLESSSSESDHTPQVDVSKKNDTATSQTNLVSAEPPSNAKAGPSTNTPAEPTLVPNSGVEKIDIPVVSQDEQNSTQDDDKLPELDPELLLALGEEIGNTPKFGGKIHQSLSRRWDPILKKGLPKDVKDALFKDHLVPENCTLLQAPRLNVEVAAAVSETSRARDKRKESDQQQLGIGISTISKAMTVLLTSDDKIEAIRLLSDGCRILADLHYCETQSRISVINFALAKPFLNIVQDNERDETLYGNKIGEKIKASTAIEKQGNQIKKYNKPRKPNEPLASTSSTRSQQRPPVTYQGNWSGPPRFQQNRGGRRIPTRPPQLVNPSRRPPPPSQLTSSAAGQTRPRAPRP